jgi:AI-2 transport protein TqsA
MGVNDIHTSRFSPAAVTIIVGGSLVLIIFGLRLLAFFVNTAFLAVIITITLTPLVNWLMRKGWPRSLATASTILLLLVVTVIMFFLLVHSFGELSITATAINEQISAKMDSAGPVLARLGIDQQGISSAVVNVVHQGVKIVSSILETIISFLSIIALAVVAAMFMLFEAPSFTRGFAGKFGSNQNLQKNLGQFVSGTRNFIAVTTLVGLLGGAIIAGALYLLKVPNPIAWGVIFWLLNYIPYVGFWLAVIPPALLAGISLGSIRLDHHRYLYRGK